MDTKILKVARIRKDLTIEQVAEQLKLNKNTYCKYEKGNYNNIRLETVKRMIDILGVDPIELLNNIDIQEV
ncbi:helix-turn-helix domain-containing protein [Clostridium neonatale]|uniref:Uncharacterized protein n=1 Tax=Clostridium neonatale TaxID=137838 RepID=A0AAD1YP01_9CLOT|nr:helix-turn-helix transcriptional regulator [Clostridium neonatale]MBP8312804.1 helix-turn-helix domain-containing protein [Clostridium neonatale]CAI3195291.1 Conserved hypothetical protein, Cro/C1-type helix-turn-helix domain [Clostridium neonatale]CAI3214054.1 Conserved hypothetical protein, Cro/C1-type helix-turn-helix domain [Clostridium neonatale]CAI3216187.1 Conserved hypothetical protein, Cro/C1-type helix-turn-helix domain [Clostridium neonatale]CAI3216715.1 Conserved hypothetical pr